MAYNIGEFDIQAQDITMSRFQAQRRQGHLERLKGFMHTS